CSVARQVEPGLVRQVALRSVARFVLMVAWSRHPRSVPGRAGDIGEVRRPGRDRLIAGIGVAQVAVEQMEERVEPLDRGYHVASVRRVRSDSFAHRPGYRVVAEAGEAERA